MTNPFPLDRPAPDRPLPSPQTQGWVQVWDPFIRVFHWSLVAAVLTAFLSEDERLGLHTWAGYLVLVLIAARLLWGLIGPHHARWTSFVRGPRATLAYLRAALHGEAPRILGHNPAGAAMAVALLAGLAATSLSGLLVLGAGEGAGPLAAYLGGISPQAAHNLEEIHEWLAYSILALVPLHLLGVAVASRRHGENLVRAMIDGRKREHLS